MKLRWPAVVGILVALAAFAIFIPPLVGFSNDGKDTPGLVEDFRVGQDGGRTRIVLQFNEATTEKDGMKYFGHRWFTLPEPARVVVDFGDITFKNSPNLLKLPQGGLAKGLRAGRFRPGTVRMVLDLTTPGRVNVFAIPPRGGQGPRLVIDLVKLKKGEQPTDVPPPADVVDQGKAPVVKPTAIEQEPAEVVPPTVTRDVKSEHKDKVTVVLDAGHGGVDPGACGRTIHLCEKYLTLDMVKLVRDRLRSDKIEVILTRDTDVFIPLPDRPRVAQKTGADLFVSLHADIHPTKSDVKGATVYMVSEKASDKEAARLASSENDRDVMAGIALQNESKEVQNILISLVQRDTLNNSIYLARSVLDQLAGFTEVRKRDVMSAGFRVLKSPDVPSILVEMGYLSNPTEERKLGNEAYREKLADVIAKGIRNYVQDHIHY